MPQQRKTNVRDVLAADPPQIINKNGLRCVLPYYYVYQTYAKVCTFRGGSFKCLNRLIGALVWQETS